MRFFIAIVNLFTLAVEIAFTMRFYRHIGKVLLSDKSTVTKSISLKNQAAECLSECIHSYDCQSFNIRRGKTNEKLICILLATTVGNVVDDFSAEHFTRNSSISTITSDTPSTYSASGLETNSPTTTSITSEPPLTLLTGSSSPTAVISITSSLQSALPKITSTDIVASASSKTSTSAFTTRKPTGEIALVATAGIRVPATISAEVSEIFNSSKEVSTIDDEVWFTIETTRTCLKRVTSRWIWESKNTPRECKEFKFRGSLIIFKTSAGNERCVFITRNNLFNGIDLASTKCVQFEITVLNGYQQLKSKNNNLCLGNVADKNGAAVFISCGKGQTYELMEKNCENKIMKQNTT